MRGSAHPTLSSIAAGPFFSLVSVFDKADRSLLFAIEIPRLASQYLVLRFNPGVIAILCRNRVGQTGLSGNGILKKFRERSP